jgi:hypothetical protein
MNKYLAALLALADIAEQRPLTPAEAGRLRTALRSYDGDRRRAGALENQRRIAAAKEAS